MNQPPVDTLPPVRAPRQPRPLPAASPADRFPDLAQVRQRLDELRIQHLDVAGKTIAVNDGKVYYPDFIVMAMPQRSYGIVDALLDAVDTYNMHAAAPLLRLQLDTLMRAHYVASCEDLDDLTGRLLRGEQFRKIKDAEGKNLTDARLQELAANVHAWAIPVYRETSGWVHFSLSHMAATTQVGDENDFFMGVPLRPTVLPESLWHEVYAAAIRATEELFDYARGWASRKGLPPGETRELDW
jgi:hypothetical protein